MLQVVPALGRRAGDRRPVPTLHAGGGGRRLEIAPGTRVGPAQQHDSTCARVTTTTSHVRPRAASSAKSHGCSACATRQKCWCASITVIFGTAAENYQADSHVPVLIMLSWHQILQANDDAAAVAASAAVG